ncbi:SDR family oxidoreductase [Methylobacterium sp. A54F]
MTADPLRLFELGGRTIVVTGGSRGIGAAIANGLAVAGATVFAIGRSSQPATPYGSPVQYLSADLCSHAEEVMWAAASTNGRINGLVNCAGVSLPRNKPEDEGQRFRETLDVNLSAAYDACRAALPFMGAGSSIVNVTSIGSVMGFPDNPGYIASKGALRMMTRALAVDLGARGIRVNALAPGYIHTAMTAGSYADTVEHARRSAHTCLGRWGTVDDLVGAAIFLLSDASAYVTGTDLFVDGGWTAKGLV